jgi:hypothetical protein
MIGQRKLAATTLLGLATLVLVGRPTDVAAARRLHAATTAGPALTVDATALGRHINPDIYGVTIFWNPGASNYAAFRSFAQQIRLPANRYGGDGTTRYNWNVDSSNAGSDWYFIAGNGQSNPVAGASVDTIVANNQMTRTTSVVTVPIIDYIDNTSPYHCSYPESVYPNQQSYDPYLHPNGDSCGNGVSAATGQYISDTNIPATDIPNTTSSAQSWVQHFVTTFGTAAHGGVGIYELDNEPNGWIAVQHDVRPQNIGYTDLTTRSIAYASAIKAGDPSALVLGPGDIAPADENCNTGGQPGTCNNDQAGNHGGTPLGLFYLQQFAAQKTRLLDYYSMHYPGSCCYSINGTLADMVTTIQRHEGWIAAAYPHTKLAYDEWNRGTGNGFSNALATADGLGVMGREGVDLASFWGLGDPSYPSAFAFQMFRNYDGRGSEFANVSVAATTADPTSVTIYAAKRGTGVLTVLLVNETATDLVSPLSLAHTSVRSVAVYEYSAANPAAIVAAAPLPPANSLNVTVPAQSLTMLVVRP